MKRYWIVAVVLGIVAVLALVGAVSAQTPVPPAPGQGFGRGMMGGMMGQGAVTDDYGYGPMHEYMETAIAEKLGISVEELEKLHADGKTFWQIAEEKGLTVEQAQQLMVDARGTALDKMVEKGVITQEQADWMKSRGGGRMGAGGCMGGGRWNNGTTTGAPRGRMGMGGRW